MNANIIGLIVLGTLWLIGTVIYIGVNAYKIRHTTFKKHITGNFEVDGTYYCDTSLMEYKVTYDGHTYYAEPIYGAEGNNSFINLTLYDNNEYRCELYLAPKDRKRMALKIDKIRIEVPEIESNEVLANS